MPRLLAQAAAGRYIIENPPPTQRDNLLTSLGIAFEHRYLFEGGASTYDDDEEGIVDLTIGGTATFSGLQLLSASVDSVNMGNAAANFLDYGAVALPVTTYVMEVWFRQPALGHSEVVLIGTNAAVELSIGSNDGILNFPSCRDNTGSPVLYWESEVDMYGDNLPHQLIEAHEVGNRNNYIVVIDGMPVASGTNGGYLVNFEKPAFNGASAETAAIRSGADFGAAYFMDNGGELDLLEVRKLFAFTALSGHDMLTEPRWFILDSRNSAIEPATAAKQCNNGDFTNDTGIRSGAIPRNGKVYFEIVFVSGGQGNTGVFVIKNCLDSGPVGRVLADSSDFGYRHEGALKDGLGTNITGLTGTLGARSTGAVFRVAIDWDTGDWWMGDSSIWLGDGGAGDPGTGANSLKTKAPIDVQAHWHLQATHIGSSGLERLAIRSAAGEFTLGLPTGYSAWDDAR